MTLIVTSSVTAVVKQLQKKTVYKKVDEKQIKLSQKGNAIDGFIIFKAG